MAKKSNGGDKPKKGVAKKAPAGKSNLNAAKNKGGRRPVYDPQASMSKRGSDKGNNMARQMGTGIYVDAPASRTTATSSHNKAISRNSATHGRASVPSKHTDPKKNVGEVQVSKIYAKARKKKK